jgi:hypothetical protein
MRASDRERASERARGPVVRYALLCLSLLVLSGCLISDNQLIPPGAVVKPFADNARYVMFDMTADSAVLVGEGRATFDAKSQAYLYADPGFSTANEYFRAAQIAPDLYMLEKDFDNGGSIYAMAAKHEDAILVYYTTLNNWCDRQSDQHLESFNAYRGDGIINDPGTSSCRFRDFDGLKRAMLEAYREIGPAPDYVLFESPDHKS